jgi:hypothetical protein
VHLGQDILGEGLSNPARGEEGQLLGHCGYTE